MANENWKKAKRIFGDAVKFAPDDRLRFLDEVCADNEIVRREVESLLASYDDANSFMESPAAQEVADVIKQDKNLEAGKCFGHYEIIKQIGAGGMGEVYLAQDKKLDRKVAVKILNEKFSGQESNLSRFIQEAKAASALNHPNILVIHEIGESENAHYIVSEFIKGETLREIFRKKTLKLPEVLDVSIQIAGALCVAHEAYLVHRDIKPENIMIRPDGFVKILDFGLAKLVEQKSIGFEDATAKRNQTAKGVILGTVNYMSPEQAKGEQIDERTDIFSLGVVIYEMLTSRTPFAGDSVSETFANLINAEPQPLSRFAANVPDDLQLIVSRTLRKNKDERFQTMKDILTDLKDLRENLAFDERLEKSHLPSDENATAILQTTTGDGNNQTTETSNSFSQRIKRNKPIVFALLAALIIASVGIGSVWYGFIKFLPRNFQMQKSIRLTAVGKAVSAAISPDGKYIVYVVEDGKQQSLWLRHIASESTVQLLPPDKNLFYGLQFSPDSNRVYYNAGKTVYQIPVLGGTPGKVLDDAFGGLTFSPDAKQIAFHRFRVENQETSIIIADADGTNQRQLVSREDIVSPEIAWSPDGKVIACLRVNRAELHQKEILAVRIADGTAAPIPSSLWYAAGQIAWMPDGKSLLVVASAAEGDDAGLSQIWQIQYPGGEARNITKDSGNYTSVSLTADGRFMVSVKLEQTAHLWTTPADDINRLRQITFGSDKSDGKHGMSWLPDGRIVYDSSPNRRVEAWVVGADGSNSKQLTTNAGVPTVSPDGRYLVFQNTTKEKIGLWRMEISDGSKKQLTQKADLWANFSPDGKWVIYQGWTDQIPPASLYKVSIDGGEPVRLTNNVEPFSPAVSPDGKQIAFSFVKMEEGKYRQKIALIPFDGGEITKMFDANLQPVDTYGKQNLQWTPDGRAINYIVLNNGVSNIWRQAIDGSAPVRVTNFTGDRIFNFAYSPDGLSLALSRGTLNSDVALIENVK